MGSLFTGIDSVLDGINDWFGSRADSYCRVETSITNTTFTGDDGSLLTFINVRGALTLVGSEEFDRIISELDTSISPRLVEAGHAIQFSMQHDRAGSKLAVSKALKPMRTSARNIGVDVDYLMDEWEDTISEYCAIERQTMVLWTRPFRLTKTEENEAKKDSRTRSIKSPTAFGCQVIERTLPELVGEHESFVESIQSTLSQLNLISDVVDTHEVMHWLKKNINQAGTGDGWRGLLPGDKLPVRYPEEVEGNDLSSLLYPTIGSQLFGTDEIIDVTNKVVRVGDSWHSSFIVTMPPQDVKPFNVLFQSLLTTGVPYRSNFLVEGAGLSSMGIKGGLASLLNFASPVNKKFNRAIDYLREMDMQGQTNIKLRMMFSTFVHNETNEDIAIDKISKQINTIASRVQSWGGCETGTVIGDPVLGLTSGLPGLTPTSPAPSAVAPLREALKMMPLTRPASPWETGSVILRSPDGKLMPMTPNSSLQASWIDIGVAPMGGGKSVWLNVFNYGFILQPGLSRLPWVSIVDIGPSSSGLIALLKASLPENKKHLVAYHRLKMTPEYSINPFDTPLGCRKPFVGHQSFLVNFISLLATELTADAPQDGVTGIARACIDAAYDEFSPEVAPKKYNRHICPTIDSVVDELNISIDQSTTWWDLVDELFKSNRHLEASIAQRYASPLLADIAGMAKRNIVTGVFTHNTLGGEKITDFFWRSLISAIKAYPILKEPTQFDVGEAQIISLDLDEVAPRGGADADRQTGVMYMLARHVVGARFFVMPSDVLMAPKEYQSYHSERVRQIREDPKRLCYDEVHRIMRNGSVAKQLVGDLETCARESRKWNLSIGLYSQSIDDMPKIMVELATSLFILGVGTPEMANTLEKKFELNKSTRYAMMNLGQPGKAGANLIAIFKTSRGTAVHVLTNTIGSQALWAFSSTTEDKGVRDKLYARLGTQESLKRLAKIYPGGVKKDIERRKSEQEELGAFEEDTDWILQVVEEIVSHPLFN